MQKVSILVILLLAAPVTAHAEDIDNPFHSLVDGLHSLVESLVASFIADEETFGAGEEPQALWDEHGPWVDPVGETEYYREALGPWTDPVGEDDDEAAVSSDEDPPLPGFGPWADPIG